MKISLGIQTDMFAYRSNLEATILPFFPSKCFSYTVISSYLHKMSTLTITKFTTSTRTVITLRTAVNLLRAITMCSSFTRDCRYDNIFVKFLGNMYYPKTVCSGILCVHKKVFQSLVRKTINMSKARPPVKCATFPLEIKQICFS